MITRSGWQRVITGRARAATVSQIVSTVALGTVAVGVSIHAHTGGLGAGEPPFISGLRPRVSPWVMVSIVVVGAGAAWAARWARRTRSPAAFAVFVFGLAVALGLALNLTREGVHGWYAVFDTAPGGSFEAVNEYLPSLTALRYGPSFFLDHFSELVPSLSINGAGHPPGLLLTMDALGLRSAQALAAFCIVAGALTAPLVYLFGRTLLDERRGRTAALLSVFAPSVLLNATVSADALYMTLGVGSAVLLISARRPLRLAGAGAAAIAALFSWLLLAIPVWAALVVYQREGRRAALGLTAACAVCLLALNGALALALGYDPIGALRATSMVYRESLAAGRPYAFWVFGSPVAWGVMLGLPTAALALRSLAARQPAAVALAAILVFSSGLGFTKAETERIWLPFVPLACVAAAASGPRRPRLVLAALAAQALLVEVLFDSIW